MATALRRLFDRTKSTQAPPSRPTKVRIKDVSSFYKTFALPNDKSFIVPKRDGTVDLFSLRTGQRIRSYKFRVRYTYGVILLDGNTAAFVGVNKIVVHRLSDGTELDHVDIESNCCADLRDRYFLVGAKSGRVQEVQCDEAGNLTLTRDAQLADSTIIDISVCGDRFAACWRIDGKIGVFEVTSFKCITSRKQNRPTCLHLTDDLLVVGESNGQIFIYDSLTLEIIHKIQYRARYVSSVHLMDDGRHMLSANSVGLSGLIYIRNIETGDAVWQEEFSKFIFSAKLLPHGQGLLTNFNGELLLHSVPEEILMKLTLPPATLPPSSPLRDALENCLSGANKPSEKCNELITLDRTRTSLDEWCCAHQLLMMAVKDGDIPQTHDCNGKMNWWLESLYFGAKDIQKGSEDEIRTIKRYVREAVSKGLVKSEEPILLGMRITKDVEAEVGALQRADILMLDRILGIEARLEMLKESFDRYRKYVRTSQLIGVALQIIPIAGGSIAGFVSAGAEIVEGLSVKDMTDYILGLGSSIADDENSSMSDRVFKIAAAALSAERLEKMEAEHRDKLEKAVRSYGMSLRTLRELFIEKAKREKEEGEEWLTRCGISRDVDSDEVIIEEIEEEREEGRESLTLESGKREDIGGPDEKRTVERECEMNSSKDKTAGAKKERFPDEGRKDWKDFKFEKEVIGGLSQEEMASCLAAYLVRNKNNEKYEMVQRCLESVLKEEDLWPDLMIDSSALPAEELLNVITNGLERNDVRVTSGIRGMARKFVSGVQRND